MQLQTSSEKIPNKRKMVLTITINVFGEKTSLKFIKHDGSRIFIGKPSPRDMHAKLVAVKTTDGSYSIYPNSGPHGKALSRKIVRIGEIYKIV